MRSGTKVIINVGSVDILHGKYLLDMRSDYEQLMRACLSLQLIPVITTLAPLPNANHQADVREKLLAFNRFLIDRYSSQHLVIDLYSSMITPSGITIYSCYET